MDSKIILNGEVTYTYPRLSTVYTRRIAKFADGSLKIWSETWGRWVSLRPLITRMETVRFTWS